MLCVTVLLTVFLVSGIGVICVIACNPCSANLTLAVVNWGSCRHSHDHMSHMSSSMVLIMSETCSCQSTAGHCLTWQQDGHSCFVVRALEIAILAIPVILAALVISQV